MPQQPSVSTTILEHEISELRLLIERYAGVLLNCSNESLIPRVNEYIEARHYANSSEFLAQLRQSESDIEPLLESLISAETGFGRHPVAFSVFTNTIIPDLCQRKHARSCRNLRVWSAGCATGEEAYTIGISICDSLNAQTGWTTHIVGSDIRRQALRVAERGLYPQAAGTQFSRDTMQTYFSRVGDHLLVKSRLRSMVAFTAMNLAQPSYLGRYDCIFCMDVMSHFSSAQRQALAQRLQLHLEPGGYLLLGDGEKLAVDSSLDSHKEGSCTYYRKPLAAAAGH